MKNVTRKSEEKILVQEHIHVDNGGTSFELIEHDVSSDQGPHIASIKISDGYYGYSENSMSLFHLTTDVDSPANLRKIAEFFIKAALALEEKFENDRMNY